MRTRVSRLSEQSLNAMFRREVTVRHIASELDSRDATADAVAVRAEAETLGYDEIGVSSEGVDLGYARVDCLEAGQLGDYQRPFPARSLLSDGTPLAEAIGPILQHGRVYVRGPGWWGISTKADLQLLPVRLYLFGLITLIEIQLLALVRRLPQEGWEPLLGDRLKQAKNVFRERRDHNIETDLAECLQLCDKATILRSQAWFLEGVNMDDDGVKDMFWGLQTFRNDLSHARPLAFGHSVLSAPDLLAKLDQFDQDAAEMCERSRPSHLGT